MTRPFVFISYSHQDEAEKDQLLAHLEVLQHAGLIELWSDDQIGVGADWQTEIKQSIARAKVAILFVTAHFLTSDFTLGQEVPAMLQRREREGLIIVPVIAKPCAWQRVDWLARLVPEGTEPVWRGSDSQVDEELAAIAEQVARIVDDEPDDDDPGRGREKKSRNRQLRVGSLVIPITPLPVAVVSLLGLLLLLFFFYPLIFPASSDSATPTPLPTQTSLFRVALAEFGEQDATGQLSPSPLGKQISQRIYESLALEFENLPVELRQDFQPVIWHDSLNPLPGGQTIGLIADEKAAAILAPEIGVDVIIYGNLNEGQEGTSFTPQFYVAPLKGEAEEIIGEHRLGQSILLQGLSAQNPQAALGLNKRLNDRVTALARFTLGLMYELGGFPQDALQVLEEAITELNLDENSGSEVFYYFIGRSNLFLKQDEKAQAAFEQALAITGNRYTRAYIGLGSVYLRRAQCRRLSLIDPSGSSHNALCRRADGQYMAPCQLSAPECQAVVQQELAQSLTYYQRVLDEALESHLKNTARLSLGMAHRVQGEIALTEGATAEADRLLDAAIEEILAILTPLEASRRYRYLGQAYLSLGAAYAQQAQIREQRDKEGSLILYQQARDAFADCIAQQNQSPYDEILAKEIVAACKGADEAVSTRQSSLQGG